MAKIVGGTTTTPISTEKIKKDITDQKFNPESENAQSGIAVAEAVENKLDKVTTQTAEVYAHNGAMQQMVGLDIVSVSDSYNKIPISAAVRTELFKKLDKTDVRDALNSFELQNPLSANQGRILNEIKQNKWEIIENTTLENGLANVITVNLTKQYQEIYIRFAIPSISATAKARVAIIAVDTANTNTTIFSETGDLYPEATGSKWYLNFVIKRFGNIHIVERNWANNSNATIYSYYNNHAKTIGTTVGDINKLLFSMTPTATRWFPVGTTYEVWGVEQ